MNLGEVAPTIDALLAMGVDELGLRLLYLLWETERRGSPISFRRLMEHNFPYVYAGNRQAYRDGPYPGRAYEAGLAVAEGWSWLEGQGLLVPLIGDRHTLATEERTLSRRAREIAQEPRLASTTRLLPKEALHPLIREDVWSLFHRGKYDSAVFEAMKAVEVRVREVSGLQAKDIGTHLMRKAFDPATGPLTDHFTEPAEREARSALFAGAIGSYKNPQSHRHVALDDPGEASEIIMLACHLLRIVEARSRAPRHAP
nr:TIGR02391 family protein [Methylobacterium sp. L1A1]